MRTVDLCDRRVDHPALVFLAHRLMGREDDTHRHDVVHILEGALLAHHLLPDRINRLDTRLDGEGVTHTFQALTDRLGKHLIVLQLGCLDGFQFVVNLLPGLWMLVFETQILQLCLNREQTQTVGQRSVYILRLTGNLVLLVLALRTQGPHVVQPVGNLNEHYTDIIADSQ